jgi:HNH endonuclease
MNIEPTQEMLKQLFTYNAEAGNFTWIAGNARGKIAGGVSNKGYRRIRIGDKHYQLHRLVWLWHHGIMPDRVGFINTIKTDSRIGNLVGGSYNETRYTKSKYKNNTSGFKGVTAIKGGKCKWKAQIIINRKQVFLGNFMTAEEASAAYQANLKAVTNVLSNN